MSFEGSITAGGKQSRAAADTRPAGLLWLLAALLGLAAIVMQIRLGLDADVSWLLIVGERVLDGGRLYVDIFEVNPPASVLIYLPGLLIARGLGLAPEFVTATLVFLAAAATIGGAGRLLRGAGLLGRERMPAALCCALFAFVVLPGACFAQREHLATLALLPLMAVLAVRMERLPVGHAAALTAGAAAGMAMAIKPHFALAVAPMFLFGMWRMRSFRLGFQTESWAAAAVVLVYGLAVLTLFPEFLTDAIPLLRVVYLPAPDSIRDMWLSPAMLVFVLLSLVCLFVGRSRMTRGDTALPLLAALGFAAAMGVQGRGYLNHAFPAVALAIFVLALLVSEPRGERVRRTFGAAACLLLGGLAIFLFLNVTTYPEVAQLVRRVAPAQPRMMVAASNLSVGHPLTRRVDGQWVGRRGALWATGAAVALLDQPMTAASRARLFHYIDEDRRIFVEDVMHGRPDVVLVPGVEGRQWIASNADVGRVLARYRKAGTAQDVDVMVRAPLTRGSR